MIARVWCGRTRAKDFEAYTDFLRERAIPDYLSTPGIEQLAFHRRRDNEFAHFQLITYWRDLKDIEGFAGSDSGLAKYYPEDEQYLLEFEERVQHYDVFAMVDVT